ncbi:MAG: molybdopterin cofactor-binding domain-containing protein, partial [Pseudomonadota bacterium]
MSGLSKLSRRDFLKRTGQVAGGLALVTQLPAFANAAGTNVFQPNVYIAVREDGGIDIVCHRSEMGQGVRTSLQQVFADELEASWDSIRLLQAEGDAKYGDQNTDGSTSIRRHLDTLRRAGATARHMLR